MIKKTILFSIFVVNCYSLEYSYFQDIGKFNKISFSIQLLGDTDQYLYSSDENSTIEDFGSNSPAKESINELVDLNNIIGRNASGEVISETKNYLIDKKELLEYKTINFNENLIIEIIKK